MQEVKSASKPKKLSILPTIIGAFGASYFLSSVLYLGLILLQFASPQIVNLLIDFVETDEPTWRGYFYTFLIAASTIVVSVLNSQSFYQVWRSRRLNLDLHWSCCLYIPGISGRTESKDSPHICHLREVTETVKLCQKNHDR